MKKISGLIVLIMTVCVYSKSQDLSAYQKKWMVQGGDTLPYRVLLPLNYDAEKKYPVIFFLHGRGERGSDNERQLIHGSKLFANEDLRRQYPAIVIFPQCAVTDFWSNVLRVHDADGHGHVFLSNGPPTRYMILLQELVTWILQTYPVKKDRVYVGGLSMGGMGTFELVRRMPGVFAAAFPICGGAHPATAVKMKDVSWWVFHGAKDNTVLPSHSENIVKALRAAGAKVKFTLYPEADHDSWDSAFAEPELMSWLFSQHR